MIPESEWTKNQREFVGSTFPTPKGGVLTVVGVSEEKVGSNTKFICECSVCSKDVELWPLRYMLALKTSLKRGSIPCGCSKAPQWEPFQDEILTQRLLDSLERPYKVVGSVIKNKSREFILECLHCSTDVELWPYGSIRCSKYSLGEGVMPCACSKSPNYTETQREILVRRECKKRGYIFHGWASKFSGFDTYLHLTNTNTNNTWKSTTIGSLLQGFGDPVEGYNKSRELRSKPEDYHKNEFFLTGKFLTGTKFFKLRSPLWNYTCPVCSNDEYVLNGLCSGVFESTLSQLKQGALSCRCSSKYRWTQEQREYQIKKLCNKEGFTFVSWTGKYKNNLSKFNWFCDKNHKCETSVACFINSGRRCNACARNIISYYGYFPDRKHEKDYLYVLDFNGEYIKIGRSFDVIKRIKELSRVSGIAQDQITPLMFYTGIHQDIYDTEQWLHEELTERGYYHYDSIWTVETFTEDCLQAVNYLIKDTCLNVIDTLIIKPR